MIDRTEAKRAEEAARANAGPLARKAIQYSDIIATIVEAAKQPDFDRDAGWAMIDIPRFIRYGAFREVIDWPQYRDLLNQWAGTTDFWYNFRRISETADRVFWEIEEHNTPKGAPETIVNSMTAFQFD
ncbi:MAG: hypothetical protein QM690_16090, partial [Sphingobium sp.]